MPIMTVLSRDDELVRLEIAEGIGTIRLDRPPVNALNDTLVRQLGEAAEAADADPDVRAVMLYGGERCFAAGADIKEMAEADFTEMSTRASRLQSALDKVAAIGKPVAAAITGYALGGGLELALAADIRIAGERAKLGQPEILLGVIPGAGGTQRLPRLIGPSRAKDLVFTGRNVPAAEALALGLVDQVVPDGDVHETARAWLAKFVTGPAVALRAAKLAVDRGLGADLATGLAIERALFAGLFGTADQREGMRAFLAKTPPKFN
jgi:enoyl-CoA hydratase/carnithine racemase